MRAASGQPESSEAATNAMTAVIHVPPRRRRRVRGAIGQLFCRPEWSSGLGDFSLLEARTQVEVESAGLGLSPGHCP